MKDSEKAEGGNKDESGKIIICQLVCALNVLQGNEKSESKRKGIFRPRKRKKIYTLKDISKNLTFVKM